MNGRRANSNLLGTLKHEIEEGFTRDIPPSESRHGRLIRYAKKEYKDKTVFNEIAATMLVSFQGKPLPNDKHDLGTFIGRLWHERVPCRADAELASDAYSRWSLQIAQARQAFDAWNAQASATLQEKRENLEKLEREYVEQRSLKEPATYWNTKKWVHRLTFYAVAGLFSERCTKGDHG